MLNAIYDSSFENLSSASWSTAQPFSSMSRFVPGFIGCGAYDEGLSRSSLLFPMNCNLTSSPKDSTEIVNIDERVVEWCWSNSDNIWFAFINNDAIFFQAFQDSLKQARVKSYAQLCTSG